MSVDTGQIPFLIAVFFILLFINGASPSFPLCCMRRAVVGCAYVPDREPFGP